MLNSVAERPSPCLTPLLMTKGLLIFPSTITLACAPNDNTQHSLETDINASGGIRTDSASKRAATDSRLRPRGHRNGYHNHTKFNIVQALTFIIIALRNINCSIWSVVFTVQWVTDRLRVEWSSQHASCEGHTCTHYIRHAHMYVSGRHYHGSVSFNN
jgi:hypothetical protein